MGRPMSVSTHRRAPHLNRGCSGPLITSRPSRVHPPSVPQAVVEQRDPAEDLSCRPGALRLEEAPGLPRRWLPAGLLCQPKKGSGG